MKLFINGIDQDMDFDTAVKKGNNVYLKKNGEVVAGYEGIADMSTYNIEGGEFTVEKTVEEELAELKTLFAHETTPIEELKNKLEQSDYKIIKCMENTLVGLPLPYNVYELRGERQKIRDEINELQVAAEIE